MVNRTTCLKADSVN